MQLTKDQIQKEIFNLEKTDEFYVQFMESIRKDRLKFALDLIHDIYQVLSSVLVDEFLYNYNGICGRLQNLSNMQMRGEWDVDTCNIERNRIRNSISSLGKELYGEVLTRSLLRLKIEKSKKLEISEVIDQIKLQDNSSLKLSEDKDEVENPKGIIKAEEIENARYGEAYCTFSNIEWTPEKDGFKLSLKENRVSFRGGEITAIIGHNASGKSTLMNILSCIETDYKGDLEFPIFKTNRLIKSFSHPLIKRVNDYFELSKPKNVRLYKSLIRKVKYYYAYVPQNLPKKIKGNLKEILHYEAAIYGSLGRANEERVQGIINRLNLEPHIHKSWEKLSNGYKLRFMLAKAVLSNPKFLLLDEPLASLDPDAQSEILVYLKRLSNENVAIAISSCYPFDIENISDHILVLNNGQEKFYGTRSELSEKVKKQKLASGKSVFQIGPEKANPVSFIQTEKRLKDLNKNIEILDMGNHFRLFVPNSIPMKEIINHLLNDDIQLDFFRNVSSSTMLYLSDLSLGKDFKGEKHNEKK